MTEENEYLRNGKYFPQGYYERFLNDNQLKDTEKAKDFFLSVCDIAGYHGEEAIQYVSNLLAKWEIEYENEYENVSRIERK
jgi:hypothetical protein